ncbi:Cof-type HAD-IIB family hydrolase [Paenibacillus fonticola]|uniref:Cof-type HAD-IIB family hydrolase n=1 Tax=Paenibacillus fonticola TaxID=379896 RepID=UPI000475A1A3|nr:Cof-type HAD-IIB family hydrolase [Paenibacillus fonticola]
MNYKLIALDVDGTLLNDNLELTQGTIETIQKIAAQGTEFVLCTGRSPASSIPLMKQMGLKGYVIAHNGAATVDTETMEVIHEFELNSQALTPYMDYCRKNSIHFDVNTTFALYVPGAEGLSQEALELYKQFFVVPQELPPWAELNEPIVKITISGHMDQLDKVYADWSKWDNSGFTILRSGDFFIDITHGDSSKGAALKKLAEKRGIPPENVMAIGNYYNDISMLTYAGYGIAMDNSPIEVKAAAKWVTASNNEEGVRLALEKYCCAETLR